MKITVEQLKGLLNQQKHLVAIYLHGRTSQYNIESVNGQRRSYPLDKDKMRETAMNAPFPEDFNILEKYNDESK